MNIQFEIFTLEKLEESAGAGLVKNIPSGLISCMLGGWRKEPQAKAPESEAEHEASDEKVTKPKAKAPEPEVGAEEPEARAAEPQANLTEPGIYAVNHNSFLLRMLSAKEIFQCAPNLTLFWWNQGKRLYEKLEICFGEYRLEGICQMDFYQRDLAQTAPDQMPLYETVLVRITDEKKQVAFENMVTFVTNQYYHYIMLRMNSYESEYSGELIGYPWQEDHLLDEGLEEFSRRQWENPVHRNFFVWCRQLPEQFEVALSLENHLDYECFLKNPESLYQSIPFKKEIIRRIYIGNPWCRFQFPKEKLLTDLILEGQRRGFSITLVWPLLQADKEGETRALLDKLRAYPGLEMAAADLGMLSLLSEYRQSFSLSTGLLMDKKRRDPRMNVESQRQLESGLWQELLKSLGVTRMEINGWGKGASVGKLAEEGKPAEKEKPAEEGKGTSEGKTAEEGKRLKRTIHLPLYQTNSGQLCPLRALIRNKSRARQEQMDSCEHFCEHYSLAYPRHLDMCGVYNSLFAVDKELMKRPDLWKNLENSGVDRLVWNLWKGQFVYEHEEE